MAQHREVVVASLQELKRVLERLDVTLSGLLSASRQRASVDEGQLTEDSIRRTELEIELSKRRIQQAKTERDLKIQYSKDSFGYMTSLMRSLYIATGSHNRKLFSLLKAFNIAQALMDTYTAFNRTLASLPYPFNLLAAGMVLAQGLARVQQIRAVTPGGGGTGSRTSTAGAIHTTALPRAGGQPAQPSSTITIHITNPLTGSEEEWERLVEERIVPAIRKVAERNIEVT